MSKQPEQAEPQLCPNCGTPMAADDSGENYCPKCSAEIDWGLEEEEDVV